MHIKNWRLYFAAPPSQSGLINTEIVNHLQFQITFGTQISD